jgi:hypothetical protein
LPFWLVPQLSSARKTLPLGYGDEAVAGEDFLFLRNSALEYTEIRKRVEAIKKPKIASETVAIIAEPDSISEIVAYDAVEKTF